MKDMNIASIKLKNGGLKGMLINYALPETRKNVKSTDEIKHTIKVPIHQELEDAIKTLRGPILDICDYPTENRDQDILDVEISGITYGEKGFLITGTKDVCDGKKQINLVTPLITSEDDYQGAHEITQIIDNIYDEVKAYASGEKQFDEQQLVMAFNKNNEEFDKASFESMSDEEKRDLATTTLEGLGCIVLNPEEGESPEQPEAKEEAPAKPEVKEPTPTMEVVKEEAPQKKTKAPKKPATEMVEAEDGTFSIVAAQPETSTARKVAQG